MLYASTETEFAPL